MTRNENTKARPRVVGLIRLSTAEQAAEGRAGIDRQRHDIEAAARLHGLEVIRTVEVIESGTKVRGQRDFEQIFRDLKAGAVDGVVCSNLDRLVRPDCFEDFGIFDHFRSNRKRIWTPGEVVDPATQNGFLVSGVRGLLAGIERQLIVARTTAGKEELRKRGWHPNGDQLLPRGVSVERIKEGKRTVDFRWHYEEPDASLVHRAFQLLLAGHSYRSIAATIGSGWTGNGIRCAMRNSIWHGVRTFPPTADRKEPLERRVIPEAEALITRAMWEKAQSIIAGRKQEWGARLRQPRFLCAGLLDCNCGRPYYIKSNSRGDQATQQEHYVCSSRHPKYGPFCGARSPQRAAVDAVIVGIVKNTLRDPALLLRIVELSERQKEAATDVAKLEQELVKLEARRQRWIDQFDKDRITEREFEQKMDAVAQAKRGIEALLPAKAPALDAKRLVKAIVKYFASFEHRPFEEQRQILRVAFKKFIVENGTIPAATLNGGFLGSMDGVKVSRGSRWQCWRRCRGRARQWRPR
jgi:DNA invertase Pin-like site-specific DNA recombinase